MCVCVCVCVRVCVCACKLLYVVTSLPAFFFQHAKKLAVETGNKATCTFLSAQANRHVLTTQLHQNTCFLVFSPLGECLHRQHNNACNVQKKKLHAVLDWAN